MTYYVVNPSVKMESERKLIHAIGPDGSEREVMAKVTLVFCVASILSMTIFHTSQVALVLFAIAMIGACAWICLIKIDRDVVCLAPWTGNSSADVGGKMFECVSTVSAIRQEVEDLYSSMDQHAAGKEAVSDVLRTLRHEEWEAAFKYRSLMPYLKRQNISSLMTLLDKELKFMSRHADKCREIANTVYELAFRFQDNTSVPKAHLDVMSSDLRVLCDGLMDLDAFNGHELEASVPAVLTAEQRIDALEGDTPEKFASLLRLHRSGEITDDLFELGKKRIFSS